MQTNNDLLDLLQQQLERQFQDKLAFLDGARAAVEKERIAALEALAQLRRSVNGNELMEQAMFGQVTTLADAVALVIHELIVGDFTINTVIELVGRHYPEVKQPINPTSVSGILRGLYKEKVLEMVEHGSGPKPSVYRLVSRQERLAG